MKNRRKKKSKTMSMQRDHLFNRSTRPLLDAKNHQPVQVKKKSSTDYKLHGFNDFNFVANQYKNFSNTHSGYPYGSPPPSPPIRSLIVDNGNYVDSVNGGNGNTSDIIFSDDSGIHINNTSNFSNQSILAATSTLSTNYYDDVINSSSNCSYQTSIGQENGKIYKKGFLKGWSNRAGKTNKKYNNNDTSIDWRISTTQKSSPKKSSTKKKVATVAPTTINQLNSSGPFIFGVHSNSCYTLPKVNNESVINSTAAIATTKYSSIEANHIKNDDIYHHDAVNGKSESKEKKKDLRLLRKDQSRTKREKRYQTKRNKTGNEIKCVVVGDGMVGKTNLILSYLEHRFTTEHVPTASDIYNFEVKVDDNPVQVTLCDTAGQDFLDPLRRLCYPDSDVFLLCFSVVKPDTFVSIREKWAPNFKKSNASIVLIGTQADLRTDPRIVSTLLTQNEKPVSKSDAWDYAASIDAKYIETSSRTNQNVKEAFDTAIWDALISLNLPAKPSIWKRLLCLT